MFIRYKGKTKTIWLPKKASQAFTAGSAVAAGTATDAGTIIPATSETGALRLMGVIRETVASTDSDYASNTKVPVEVPVEKGVEWIADVASNTLSLAAVKTNIGNELDLSNHLLVNLASSSTTCCIVKDVISTAKVVVSLKINNCY